ncbi:MAG TPA: hypothetical protein VH834_11140 [Solirubrobacteraceae bacterium]|jgi:hypothetical protein
MIIRVFRPTIYRGKEREFAGDGWEAAVITPDEEHLLKETWIGHYEHFPASG